MGWRGVLRDLQASSRRAERESYRRQRALERQNQQYERMHELERIRYEVELYENRLDLLTSVHKECGSAWDWVAIQAAPRPAIPVRRDDHERSASLALARYSPGLW